MSSVYTLRKVQEDDHAWLVDLHNDPEVLRNLTNPRTITLEDHMRWWRNIEKDPAQLREIFEVDGERVGFTKFYNIDFANLNCSLGADIERTHRRKGYAKEMWRLMLRKCFDEMRLHRVSLTTASYNVIAQKTYVGLGFAEEGRMIDSLYRDGRFYDQICMYLLSTDRRENESTHHNKPTDTSVL